MKIITHVAKRYPDPYGLSPLREYSLKGGSVLSSFQDILEGEEQSSTKKEESNHDDDHADETRTGRGARLRR
jgi:hypothetical protein